MKPYLKFLGILFLTSIIYSSAYSQLPPVGVPGAGGNWRRGGNTAGGGNDNIFGTQYNSPIYSITANSVRTRLSGSLPNVNALGAFVDLTGHFGIGLNGCFANINNPPLTMLHLEGTNNTPFNNHFGGQYRTWMRVGAFMRENSDAMYVGLKPETGTNRSDAVINWSDDGTVDKLRFLFTSTLLNLPGAVDPLRTDSQNGYEFMRMTTSGPNNQTGTASGHVGIGPLFTDALPPQNRVHMNAESGLPTYLQVSNVTGGGVNGTDQTAQDGLKLGIERVGFQTYQTAFLKWQEESPFIVQTDWNNIPGGVQQGERMRISSIAANGVPDPASPLDNNITRVAISHHGSEPITAPRSLLHLGYNTSTVPVWGMVNDGWRNWMDVGTFTNIGSDNMYVGLKDEGDDRYDAVVSWGDNQVPGLSPDGPDYLRFIFTSTTTALPPGTGDPESVSNEGLDMARMDPRKATTMPNNNYGMMGIGDWETPGNPPIDAKLDIDGDLRIRTVTQDNNLTRFLVIDSADQNRVHYADLSIPPSGGGYGLCSDPPAATNLTDDGRMGLNDKNFYFDGMGTTNNQVGIGYTCLTPMNGKLSVRETSGNGIGVFSHTSSTGGNVAGLFRVDSGSSNTAVQGNALGGNTTTGGLFTALGGTTNYGVHAIAPIAPSSFAGYFDGALHVTGQVSSTNGTIIASDQQFKENIEDLTGALNLISQLQPRTFDFDTSNFPGFNFETDNQMGLIAQEVELVIPTLVTNHIRPAQYDSLGIEIAPELAYKGVEYEELIPLLIAGVQEQQAVIEDQQNQIASRDSLINDLNDRLTQLENCLANILPALCNANNHAPEQTPQQVQDELRSIIDVELRNSNNIVLNQNVPNPFAERTVISYSIPTNVGRAQIHFYNGLGELINTVEITERGEGQLNVFANDLSSGVYTYSLVADGKVVSTKRMVKQ